MPKVPVLNMEGKQVGEIDLADSIFGIEPNKHVLHEAVVMQLASLRRGTHDVKNRSEVRGGGRKPWRQKGTGRARQGSIRAPQWVGGGTVFGPTPRSYAYKLPKKVRRLALKSALSTKVLGNSIIVLDSLNFDAPKTKEMVRVLANVKAAKKALVVGLETNTNAELSARNIPGVKFVTATGINVYDLLNHESLVITKDAVAKVEEVFA
ncbi:50S ribosomal protein L4 [Effusibacillus lacus]|uniref:Large ribosomal subunit protein uL4 n=1 Tax=Effusibacillus lacus TaxID=1348429 RepID=A0A292YLI1_9BACL|nr:50S ribosomal protein L4 [Effusibacillus lacus]TCS69174.1 large subunit ribosomal protein L4 [Effusibacillus lacus]GAX89320.1 50S ribosomal protein L4 [Effusibacillus lacus]